MVFGIIKCTINTQRVEIYQIKDFRMILVFIYTLHNFEVENKRKLLKSDSV